MAFVELGFFFVSSICTKKVILSFFPVRFTSVFFFFLLSSTSSISC